MNVLRKNHSAQFLSDPHEFIFSDGSVDSYGDVITQSGWDLADFRRNPIALLGHDQNFVIGSWKNVRVVDNTLRGHLHMAPEGTSTRIDEIRKLIHAGILKSCSVGFMPVESMPLPGSRKGGVKYLKQRLVEVSVVAVPANVNALMLEAKHMGISSAVIRSVFKQSTDASLAERQANARAVLAKARAIVARPPTTKPVALIGMNATAKARYARAKAARERAEAILGRRSPQQIAAAELKRAAEQCAVPQRTTFGDWDGDDPLITFAGQQVYRKKNKYGW